MTMELALLHCVHSWGKDETSRQPGRRNMGGNRHSKAFCRKFPDVGNHFLIFSVSCSESILRLVTNLTFSDGVNKRPFSLWEVLLDTG